MNRFSLKTKIVCFTVSLLVFVVFQFPLTAFSAQETDQQNMNKGQRPEVIFPVISDVHIEKNGMEDLRKFETALNQLNEHAPHQDAFVVVGDLTDYGLKEEYERFFSIYNEKKNPQAVSLFTIGNHDYWNGLSIEDAQKRFLDETGMGAIYGHKVIKDYHFIWLGPENGVTEGYYSKEQIQWLDKQLNEAEKDDPRKPIFVFLHQPLTETVFGSEWGTVTNRDLLYNTLKKYPQSINFSGHTHYPLDDPRTIHQENFTSVGTSSVKYMWTEAGYLQGELPPGHETISQGLIVEAYKNKVVIKRRDFHNDAWVGEDWVIKRPFKPQTFKYTETRDHKAPYFTKDAEISAVKNPASSDRVVIKFTQADDNLLVHSYKVVAREKDTGQVALEYEAFSEYYRNPVPDPLLLPVQGLKPDTGYTIEVTAIDAFENESQSNLTLDVKTKP
ncbi:metallophosphoesterase [Gracilibacillus dipsosauri]|uniref:Phosphatase n=1 Tax=Gracilibacillus dipsosauri TaxID=178340 RepID=A0A317KTS0_9BACI|nr:metallophosphoesterase [Gracilibacillus dipsosauri]PWU66922.1 phosphatase [Gracilibacillus dipsosauri]